nr:MAG TPA: hypothetical protein [Caudoviricetes sp.]
MKKERAEALTLLLFLLRPFGFFLISFRFYYQADGSNDCEKGFRKVFDYFSYRIIHMVSSFLDYVYIIARLNVLVKGNEENYRFSI